MFFDGYRYFHLRVVLMAI